MNNTRFLYCFVISMFLPFSYLQAQEKALSFEIFEDSLQQLDKERKLTFVQEYYHSLPQKDLALTSEIYFQYAQVLMNQQQYDSVPLLLEKAIDLQQRHQLKSQLAKSYHLFSQYFSRGSKFDKRLNSPNAYEMSKKAFELYQEIGDQKGLAYAKLDYGVLQNRMGEYYKAKDFYFDALYTFKSISDTLGIYKAHLKLAEIYGWMDRPFFNLDSSVIHARAAIKVARQMPDVKHLAYAFIVSASPIIRKGYEAPEYLQEGLEISQAAKYYYQDNIRSPNYQIAYLNEGFALEALGKLEAATQVAQDFLQAKIPDLDMWTISEAYRLLSRIEKQRKRYDKALEYYEQYRIKDDSVRNIDLRRRLSKLEQSFTNLAKDKEIESLAQQAKIQALELQNRNWQLFGLGVFVLLALTGGYFFYLSHKNKAEKAVAELNQRFLRSQLNPHFIFNAIGAIQHYFYKFGVDKGNEYLGVFSRLMRQILEFSREEFISLEDECETLTNYLELQKMRFQDQFSYEIEIDPDLETEMVGIPPMFAQPVIENALEHGLFKNGATTNHINIHFQKVDEERIRLCISDTGIGLGAEKSINEAKHQSLSTVITQERLAILRKQSKHSHYERSNRLNQLGKVIGAKVEFELPLVYV